MNIYRRVFGPNPVVSIVCGLTSDRKYLLDRTLAEMEVIFAGQAMEYVFAVSDAKPWNECKAKNAAAREAYGEYLLFTNCDIVIGVEAVKEACDVVSKHNCMAVVHRLDEQADGTWKENGHAIGDFQLVHRRLFEKSGGFDERMTGWGYLDYDFAKRCWDAGSQATILNKCRIIHHWHPRLTDAEYRAMNQTNRAIAQGSEK